GRGLCTHEAAYPQASGTCPSVATICAQIAIIPRNSASEAKAAASSIKARNMSPLPVREQERNIVHFMFSCQCYFLASQCYLELRIARFTATLSFSEWI